MTMNNNVENWFSSQLLYPHHLKYIFSICIYMYSYIPYTTTLYIKYTGS